MATTTLTMAGHLAHAGAARPAAALGAHLVAIDAGYATHQASSWTTGAIAMPTTGSKVFGGRKNRPTRPLSELSP